jgi:hypothetical protein
MFGMMLKLFSLLYFISILIANANAADILKNGEMLINDGYISSPNGKYKLIMQIDGSLVMYRNDGSIRYAMEKRGNYAIMQNDGNFVQYRGASTPIWDTGTWGNTMASSTTLYRLVITDDGNLLVVQESISPMMVVARTLWEIGPDKSPPPTSNPAVYPMEKLSPPGPPPSNVPPRINRPAVEPWLTQRNNPRY